MSTRNPLRILASLALTVGLGAALGLLAAAPANADACTARHHAIVTNSDDETTVCLAVGASLRVRLLATGATHWQVPEATSDVLRPVPGNGPNVTVTSGAFTAAHSGTADVTSTKPSCPQAQPGTMACMSIQLYRVHIIVP
jgi:hypothetical protein